LGEEARAAWWGTGDDAVEGDDGRSGRRPALRLDKAPN